VDDTLFYNAFHADFGPLHIGHLYRFAVYFHAILGDPANTDRAVIFWSKPDSRSRANAACLVACYMVLIQSWPPHLALAPIAQVDPPYMPFRDAGYSQADFILTIQDVVYGIWKAKEESLCGLKDFSIEEYVVLSLGLDIQILIVVPVMKSTKEWIWVTSTGSHHILSPSLHPNINQRRQFLQTLLNMPLFPQRSQRSMLRTCLSHSKIPLHISPPEILAWLCA
jgi:Dual specificity protein phosphatase, N-terminal half